MDNPQNIDMIKQFIDHAKSDLHLLQQKDEHAFKKRILESKEFLTVL